MAFRIGNIGFEKGLFLAPMVDVTDLPYRLLCRKQGAEMAYTEMLHIEAILHENQKTLNSLKTTKEDRPLGLQITGKSVKEFEDVVPHVNVGGFDLVDINCGCPSIRITGSESGSYLLENPEKIGKMISVLKDQNLIVTAKIRLGFKNNNVMKVAKIIEKSGADALTLHARLANQGRSVKADWSWLKKVKKEIGIPLIGNGDVFSGEKAAEMLDITDGVMIAGAAIGNPLIFREIKRYLKTGKEKEVFPSERIKAFKDYLKLAEKHNVLEISRVKYLGGSFLRGFPEAAKEREKLMKAKDIGEIKDLVENL